LMKPLLTETQEGIEIGKKKNGIFSNLMAKL
jgi:hypothetical protein